MSTASTVARTEPVGLERPPGWLILSVTGVAAAIALEASSRDGGVAWFVAMVAWVSVFTVWLVRLLFLAAPQARMSSRWRLRWALPMLILVGAAVLITVGTPVWLRFEASRPAFDQMVAEVMAGGSTDRQSVGLYDIDVLERTRDGVRLLVEGSGFIDASGFAYAPDGDPTQPGSDDIYRPLGGGWYRWIVVF